MVPRNQFGLSKTRSSMKTLGMGVMVTHAFSFCQKYVILNRILETQKKGVTVMARKTSMDRAMEKVGGFATAKKRVAIQFQGRERSEEHILQQVRTDALEKGMKDEEISTVDIYIKPEEGKVFYVINKEVNGSIAF